MRYLGSGANEGTYSSQEMSEYEFKVILIKMTKILERGFEF